MPEPKSLSIAKISKAVEDSVNRVIEQQQHKAFRLNEPLPIGFVPPHWWVGFVLYDQNIDRITFSDAQSLASRVHTEVAKDISDFGGGKAGAVLSDGYLTIGFVAPMEKFNLIEK